MPAHFPVRYISVGQENGGSTSSKRPSISRYGMGIKGTVYLIRLPDN
jgi:hypothetical protein